MSKKPKKPDRPPGTSDVDLFEAAMRDVEALKKDDRPAPPEPPVQPSKQPARPHVAPPVDAPRSLAPLSAGKSGDVDTRTLDRLKRGQLRPQARLDLHGMTQDEAHRALSRFIPQAQSSGKRCVIVITGKGSVAAGGGVLRRALPGWLNAPALRPSVLAYAEAAPREGGGGAVYLLLRRNRR